MNKKKPGIMTPTCNLVSVESGLPDVPSDMWLAAYVMDDRLIIGGNRKLPTFEVGYDRIQSFRIIREDATKDKSSVGRAVVGGALMGPLGAVVGAASGAGEKRVTRQFLEVWVSGRSLPLLARIDKTAPSAVDRFVRALSKRARNADAPDECLAGKVVRL